MVEEKGGGITSKLHVLFSLLDLKLFIYFLMAREVMSGRIVYIYLIN